MRTLTLILTSLLLAAATLTAAAGESQKYGARLPGPGAWATEPVDQALSWLALHQDESGCWVSDGFPASCNSKSSRCRDNGAARRNVRATAVSLLAFMAVGTTQESGPYAPNLERGLAWLRAQQDPAGRIGEGGEETLLDHALATLVLTEAAYFARDDASLTEAAQAAMDFSLAAELHLHSDPAVLGWALLCLRTAAELKLTGLGDAREDALERLLSATRPAGPRGSLVSFSGEPSKAPAADARALTAMTLLTRIFLEEQPGEQVADLERYGEYLLASDLNEEDWVLMHYATFGIYQLGGPQWSAWLDRIRPVLIESQRDQRHMDGSWDPTDETGGRVFFTALNALNLTVYMRYARMLSPR